MNVSHYIICQWDTAYYMLEAMDRNVSVNNKEHWNMHDVGDLHAFN